MTNKQTNESTKKRTNKQMNKQTKRQISKQTNKESNINLPGNLAVTNQIKSTKVQEKQMTTKKKKNHPIHGILESRKRRKMELLNNKYIQYNAIQFETMLCSTV